MQFLVVKNWGEFQHYKDRNPPWIKLHRALLDDYEFSRLQDASKAHLMLIWLFSAGNDGQIPNDPKFLQAKLGLDKQPDLQALVNSGFLMPLQDASRPIADCQQGDSDALVLARSREKRREEAEKSIERFTEFWAAYPRKVAKPQALKAWKSLNLVNGDFEKVMAALATASRCEQWRDTKFIPHPATWLRGRRFEDEENLPPAIKVDG